MAFVTLKIPTLVQHVTIEERPHYHLRPLFLQHPVATHRRYDFAISQYQKEVKHLFKGFALQLENADQLLWYLFNPTFEYKHVRLRFTISRQFIDGLFTIVHFQLKDLTFVLLPGLENFMFIARGKAQETANIFEQAEAVIKRLLREIKEDEGPAFQVEDYYSHKRDFVTITDLNVNINHAAFKFDQNNDSWFFTRLFDDTEFDGGIEIEKVGQDLNSFFPAQLKRAYYKEKQVELVYNLLFQQNVTPFALIGPEGVGKHSLIQEAVYRYMDDHYTKNPGRRQQVWHLDPTRIIAGMSLVGMWQKRFEAIIQYARKPNELEKNADLLLIDNPVALLRIGKSAQNNMTLSDVLKPYLEKRLLQVALIATNEEWKVIQEKDRRFSDLFQVIRVSEPSLTDATHIVLKQRKMLELENNATITVQALQQLFELQRNYLRGKALPGSIMKLLTQLAVKYRHRKVDVPQVRDEFRAFSGLEERIFGSDQLIEKEEVEKVLAQELVGQPQAVKNLAQVVHLIKAKLADKSKPISSFLFIGPTGVGKTQAAKVLNAFLMGRDSDLIRFDMNEYINEDAVQRLIGDYYNPEGQLTGKVRYKNFGVILLDEIEKAHPKVHDLLLQVLDDGRLTDSLGRTVDFTNMIIIMTSNVGANRINDTVQIKPSPVNEALIYRRAVENRFRPEFINRIDEIVIFNPLELL